MDLIVSSSGVCAVATSAGVLWAIVVFAGADRLMAIHTARIAGARTAIATQETSLSSAEDDQSEARRPGLDVELEQNFRNAPEQRPSKYKPCSIRTCDINFLHSSYRFGREVGRRRSHRPHQPPRLRKSLLLNRRFFIRLTIPGSG